MSKTSHSSESLIGFDAREWWMGQTNQRGEEWYRQWFLRHDVVKPLSIEREIWSSVFDFFPEYEPRWKTAHHAGLWKSLRKLEEHLPSKELAEKPFVLVAFTVISAMAGSAKLILCDQCGEEASPHEIDPSWHFLGYDVADDAAWSGLLTVRSVQDRENPESFRERWGPALNRWHLFNEVAPATAFNEYSSRVIPKYTPTFVYGIWLVRGVHGGGPPSALPEGSGR